MGRTSPSFRIASAEEEEEEEEKTIEFYPCHISKYNEIK
jgi:Zn-finger protein